MNSRLHLCCFVFGVWYGLIIVVYGFRYVCCFVLLVFRLGWFWLCCVGLFRVGLLCCWCSWYCYVMLYWYVNSVGMCLFVVLRLLFVALLVGYGVGYGYCCAELLGWLCLLGCVLVVGLLLVDCLLAFVIMGCRSGVSVGVAWVCVLLDLDVFAWCLCLNSVGLLLQWFCFVACCFVMGLRWIGLLVVVVVCDGCVTLERLFWFVLFVLLVLFVVNSVGRCIS